jgi:hypothetical protein
MTKPYTRSMFFQTSARNLHEIERFLLFQTNIGTSKNLFCEQALLAESSFRSADLREL